MFIVVVVVVVCLRSIKIFFFVVLDIVVGGVMVVMLNFLFVSRDMNMFVLWISMFLKICFEVLKN